MKINSITTNTGYLKSRAKERSTGREKECVQNNLKQMNNDKINTTIKSNSDGRVSFKGGTPVLHKIANFTADNPLVAEALFALVVTCAMRPLTIMATAKTEEDKEKCAYQAAKSVSTGLVGLGMSLLVGVPIAAAAKAAQKKGSFEIPENMKKESKKVISAGIEKLKELGDDLTSKGSRLELAEQIKKLTVSKDKLNLGIFKDAGKGAEKSFLSKVREIAPETFQQVKKAFNEQKTVDNFGRTSKNIIDKMFQPIFMPVRATITVALVPTILNALGLKKNGNKKPAETKQQGEKTPIKQPKTTNFGTTNYNLYQLNAEKDIFKSFSGMVTHANK